MNKLLLTIALISPLLISCSTTSQILTSEKRAKIEITPQFFECPTVKTYPNPDNLTDIQVAKLIVLLHRNNVKCKNSMEALEQFIIQYNETVGTTEQ